MSEAIREIFREIFFKKCTIPHMLPGFPQEGSGGWPPGKANGKCITIPINGSPKTGL